MLNLTPEPLLLTTPMLSLRKERKMIKIDLISEVNKKDTEEMLT